MLFFDRDRDQSLWITLWITCG